MKTWKLFVTVLLILMVVSPVWADDPNDLDDLLSEDVLGDDFDASNGFGPSLSASQSLPSITEIEKYLIIGFKKKDEGDAVNLQNGEFGADREVLSTGGTSPTGASFPNIRSVFDQRWEPTGSEAYLIHPIDGTQIGPWEGIDYSGNIALTSNTGYMSVSDTDLFADLGLYDSAFDNYGIVAASNEPVQSISNADYFKAGDSETNPTGELPTNSRGTNGVGLKSNVDLSALTDELEAWKSFIEGANGEGTITQNIEEQSYKSGGGPDPYVIELLEVGDTADSDSDISFTDTNGDGLVIIDVNRGGSDWEINNSDVIIDGPASLTAIFRVNGGSNMNMSDSSIQIGEGGIADDLFGAIFFKGDSEGSGSGDAVFAGNNVVLNGLAFWELNEGTDDDGKNEIDIQNGQGCAQFVGSTVLHTSNSRFNKCTFSSTSTPSTPTPTPEPSISCSATPLGLANEFNMFILGDHYTPQGSDVEGRLAAAGDITLGSYTVGLLTKDEFIDKDVVIAGGDLTFTSGDIWGNAVYGGTENVSQSGTVHGTLYQGSPIDFATAQVRLEALSDYYASQTTNGTAKMQWGGLTLSGNDSELNIVETTVADLISVHTIKIDIPENSTLLVNVSGNDDRVNDGNWLKGIMGGGFDPQGSPAPDLYHRVLFNFPEATNLRLGSSFGSILAPRALLDAHDGVVWGTVVGKEFKKVAGGWGSTQINYFPFTGCLPDGAPEPTPEPTPTPGPTTTPIPNNLCTTLDFDTYPDGSLVNRGDVITNQWAEWGVHVQAINNNSSHPNKAMIFDTANPTGGDPDLGAPHKDFNGPGDGNGGKRGAPGQNDQALGKILIIAEDNDSNDPDDEADGGQIIFTFAEPREVDGVSILDIDSYEADSVIKAYDSNNNLLKTAQILGLGNNSYQLVSIDTDNVSRLEVHFTGSGSIPEISFCENAEEVYNLGDYIWFDTNQDGIQDGDEQGIAGVKLELYTQANPNTLVDKTKTDENGYYLFESLPSGDYWVKIVDSNFDNGKPLAGLTFSPQDAGNDDAKDSDFDSSSKRAPGTIASADNLTIDGGFYDASVSEVYNLGDYIWFDSNRDGIQDGDETGISSVTLTLYDGAGNSIATDTTDENGGYLFTNLPPGDYTVKIDASNFDQGGALEGLKSSPQDAGGDDAKDSDFDSSTKSASATITDSDVLTVDGGFYQEPEETPTPEPTVAPRSISPIAECVVNNGDGTYTAHFGYENKNDTPVTVPYGNNNKLSPANYDGVQPTEFGLPGVIDGRPGRTGYFPGPFAFSLPFNENDTIVWTLAGKTATASKGSAQCSEHVFVEKKWYDAAGNETDVPADLPDDYAITLNSEYGSATCTYQGSDLTCVYNNQSPAFDQQGVWVPLKTRYTVVETGLPNGWTAQAGTGEFFFDYSINDDGSLAISSNHCELGRDGVTKYCTHTVKNQLEEVTPEPNAPLCKLYSVHDPSTRDSIFFTIDFLDHTVSALNSEKHNELDFEGLDFHPSTDVLYASSGKDGRSRSDLYTVDPQTGAVTLVGQITDGDPNHHFNDVASLAFNPVNETLWGFARKKGDRNKRQVGLIQIDPATGAVLDFVSWNKSPEGLAWSDNGQILWISSGRKLYTYTPADKKFTKRVEFSSNGNKANYVPDDIEGLGFGPNGYLMAGVHHGGNINIFSIDVSDMDNPTLVSNSAVSTSNFNDVESLAWVDGCESSLGDLVWNDINGDGLQDSDEPGIENVVVNLYLDDGDGEFNPSTSGKLFEPNGDMLVATTTTDANGNYLFDGLFPGNYFVQLDESNFEEGSPTAALTTYTDVSAKDANGNSNDLVDSDGHETEHVTDLIVLPAFTDDMSWDFGFYTTETYVSLESFTIEATDDTATLQWVTAVEIDNKGFNIYRSNSLTGEYEKVNNDIILGAGDTVTGGSYTFEDTPGFGTYFYVLEDVEYSGNVTRHAPVQVDLIDTLSIRRPDSRPTNEE